MRKFLVFCLSLVLIVSGGFLTRVESQIKSRTMPRPLPSKTLMQQARTTNINLTFRYANGSVVPFGNVGLKVTRDPSKPEIDLPEKKTDRYGKVSFDVLGSVSSFKWVIKWPRQATDYPGQEDRFKGEYTLNRSERETYFKVNNTIILHGIYPLSEYRRVDLYLERGNNYHRPVANVPVLIGPRDFSSYPVLVKTIGEGGSALRADKGVIHNIRCVANKEHFAYVYDPTAFADIFAGSALQSSPIQLSEYETMNQYQPVFSRIFTAQRGTGVQEITIAYPQPN
ncbi:MAG: hypothetical protein ABIH50_07935 [bacterium]